MLGSLFAIGLSVWLASLLFRGVTYFIYKSNSHICENGGWDMENISKIAVGLSSFNLTILGALSVMLPMQL